MLGGLPTAGAALCAGYRGTDSARFLARCRRGVQGDAGPAADAGLAPMVRELHGEGLSLRAIAAKLAERGVVGGKGRPLPASRVQRILRRAGATGHEA